MQISRKSFTNLQALAQGDFGGSMSELQGGGPLSRGTGQTYNSGASLDSDLGKRTQRLIFVSNHLPLIIKRDEVQGWVFEWDEDALIAQAREGLPEEMDAIYVGCLPIEVDGAEQDEVSALLQAQYNCHPVFLGEELKHAYYKQFCKQELWPLLHYLLPLQPDSVSRFDPDLWSAYVRANMAFANKIVGVLSSLEDDFIWIHDYHLLVLPSLLRKRFHRLRCGFFLHSPFPSSEVFRTFPRRDEVLRSLLNADVIGFHTFDYARHFLSCCSRMLGLEHRTSRGAIIIEYYGRDVGIKIMPTGVKPDRLLSVYSWPDTAWRRGELMAEFRGRTVLIGVDDMDVFKGIDLKLAAFEQVLQQHPEWRGKLVLIQVTSAPRAPGRDVEELHRYCLERVAAINDEYREPGYEPIVWLERPVPLYERVALYSIADVAVVTATRDGMNLMPYEYIVCRQGPTPDNMECDQKDVKGKSKGSSNSLGTSYGPTDGYSKVKVVQSTDSLDQAVSAKSSMLVVSEFVGCSPSLSGALRVNPWSIEAVRDAIYTAIRLPLTERLIRHEKHWRYVGSHTVQFWAKSFVSDLQKFTSNHSKLQCFDLGLGLNNFKMVALTSNFRKLRTEAVLKSYAKASRRAFLLDHDGTLVGQSSISSQPGEHVLNTLRALCEDESNVVFIMSGRAREELSEWFAPVGPKLGLAAEHGFYMRYPGAEEWTIQDPNMDFTWKDIVEPILKLYTESTDGSFVEAKESALVWHYRDADPDFGSWQAKELLDHLEGVLSNEPIEVVPGQTIVEVKPQGVSKGRAAERVLAYAGESTNFVLCIGNDRSDEDMFHAMPSGGANAGVFACTVGQKPSKAPFYVNDPSDVMATLSKLAGAGAGSEPQGKDGLSVTFADDE